MIVIIYQKKIIKKKCDDRYYFHGFVGNDILYIALVLFSYITSQFESNMTLIDPHVWKD